MEFLEEIRMYDEIASMILLWVEGQHFKTTTFLLTIVYCFTKYTIIYLPNNTVMRQVVQT